MVIKKKNKVGYLRDNVFFNKAYEALSPAKYTRTIYEGSRVFLPPIITGRQKAVVI